MEQMCEWGLERGAGRTEEEVTAHLHPPNTKPPGWILGEEKEGADWRRCHLPCLPWGVGGGRAGWVKLQQFSKINFQPRLGWWVIPVNIFTTYLVSPNGWEATTPVPTVGGRSRSSSDGPFFANRGPNLYLFNHLTIFISLFILYDICVVCTQLYLLWYGPQIFDHGPWFMVDFVPMQNQNSEHTKNIYISINPDHLFKLLNRMRRQVIIKSIK